MKKEELTMKISNLIGKELRKNDYTIINGVLYKRSISESQSIHSKSDISRFKYSYLLDGKINLNNDWFLDKIENFNYEYIYNFENELNIENIKDLEYENKINIKNFDTYRSYLKVVSKNDLKNDNLVIFKQIITLKLIRYLYKIINNKKMINMYSTLEYSTYLLAKFISKSDLDIQINKLLKKLDSEKIEMIGSIYNEYIVIIEQQIIYLI